MGTTAAARIALGRYGEDVAERYLRDQGMVLLDRNWRCREGELDLVLREGNVLVVCEVKARRGSSAGTPHEAVDATKLERLGRLAERWATEHRLRPPGIRIDLVAVERGDRGAARIDHVRGLL